MPDADAEQRPTSPSSKCVRRDDREQQEEPDGVERGDSEAMAATVRHCAGVSPLRMRAQREPERHLR